MSDKKKANFLDIDDSIMKKQLLLEGTEPRELQTLFPDPSLERAAVIKPKVGLCVKTRDEEKNKVFINVCTSDAIPTPEDISDEELISILESEEPSDFRVPMSIGQPHHEKDKSGESCVAYDVVISPEFFSKMTNNPLFNNFFMVATLEGIEEKYSLRLDKNGWTVLKNKKYHGTMPEQAVRTTMPLVQELSKVRHWETKDLPGPSKAKSETSPATNKPLISEVSSKKIQKVKPKFVLEKIGFEEITTLQAKVELPEMISGQDIDVAVGEDRLVVETRKSFFDVFVPHKMDNESADAYFITSTKVLIIRVPVLSS
ncbi:PIH1 domain-containing protein 1-like isoform X1 [Macrobrachium nipponense]|uniref:PIH1 domain-containing protein 1-like isoform X1 n=1 Tax=Macrobrachium nipponense TaxID=159736 RepID=UPI0030C85A55